MRNRDHRNGQLMRRRGGVTGARRHGERVVSARQASAFANASGAGTLGALGAAGTSGALHLSDAGRFSAISAPPRPNVTSGSGARSTGKKGVRASLWARLLAQYRRLESSARGSDRLLFGVWLVTRLILLFSVIVGHAYCDPQFYHYAGQFAVGQLPYRDLPVEYPPLVFVLLLLPALPLLPFAGIAPRPDPAFIGITHLPQPDPVRYGAYAISFAVEMLVIDLITLWLVRRAASRLTPGDPTGLRAGLLYLSLTFASGALLQKFDLVVGTLCLAAVMALIERRRGLAWGLLAAATLVKGFPILAAPIFILYELEQAYPAQASGWRAALGEMARKAWRPLAVGIAWYVGVVLGVALVISLGAGPGALTHTLLTQEARDFEIESLYANVMLVVGWLRGLAVQTGFHPATLSRVVLSPLVKPFDLLATVLPFVALAASYALLLRAGWRRMTLSRAPLAAPNAEAAEAVIEDEQLLSTPAISRPITMQGMTARQAVLVGTTLVFMVFLLTFRALPGHYLLALLPLAPLLWLGATRRTWLWLAAVAVVALFGQIVTIPSLWHELVLLRPWAVAMLSLRNLSWLVALGALGMAAFGRRRAPTPGRTIAAALAPVAPTGEAPVGVLQESNQAIGARVSTKPSSSKAPKLSRRRAPRWLTLAPNAWRRLARSAPPIPGFNPRSEDVFAHLFSQVPTTRIILVAGISSAIMYLGLALAFPIVIFWNQPHVGRESSIINDLGAITGYNPVAALAFVSAVFVLLGCQFLALLAVGRAQHDLRLVEEQQDTGEQGQRARRVYRLVRLMTLGFPLLFAAIMIWMQPITTTDLYGYVARGYLFAHLGQNPMTAPAYQLPGGLSVDRPPSPYGPLWLLIAGGISWLCGENLLANMLIYKMIGALGLALSLFLIDRLAARIAPARRLRIDALFGWSPLLVYEAVGNGHNDIVMMLCVLLALTLMLRGRAQWAFAFLVLGALIKYVSAVLVPLWLVYELRHRLRAADSAPQASTAPNASAPPPSARSRGPFGALAGATRGFLRDTVRAAKEVDRWEAFRLIAGATLIGGVLTVACYAPFWEGVRTFSGLGQQLRPLYYNDSIVAFVTGPLQLFVAANKTTALDKTVRLVFYVLFIIYTAIQTYRLWRLGPLADLQDFITASAKVVFSALVLITFWFQPWYVVWLIALAPLAREPFVRRQAVIFGAGALLTYAISSYVLIDEQGVIRDTFVQLFEIVVTFGPLLILRATPYEDGWASIVRRYLGMVGEGINRRPVFWERIMLALVLMVAAALRLLGLGSLTGQISNATSEVATLKAVSADLRLFLSDPQGLHGPFVAVQGVLVRIFGPTPLAALLPSAVLGTLTVFVIYLLTEEIMRQGNLPGRRMVGILAALLAATSRWHVSLSRSGMEVILLPLLVCLAVYWLLLAFRLRRELFGARAEALRAPHTIRRRTRRSLVWALRHNGSVRSLYRGIIVPVRRQYLHGRRLRAEQVKADAAEGSSASEAASARGIPLKIVALYAASGFCTGLACDLEPGLWLAPLVVLGFLLVWRWRQPQALRGAWTGLLALTGAALLAGIPTIWYFLSQVVGFPEGSSVLARSSIGIQTGPGLFSPGFWGRVGANLSGALNLLISQDYSAGYPAVGGAQIIPALLGPFFFLGMLILLYHWRNPTMLATLLLIALPLVASVSVSSPTGVIEAASVLPAMCILPAIAIYQVASFLGSLPILLDRLHGVRVFTTPEQIGRLALLVFLLASAIRTFFWLFEATLPSQTPNNFLPSYVAPALALLPTLLGR